MAFSFANVVTDLMNLGFYDFVLPWLLFFAVILGLLNATKVFGEPKEAAKINSIIAAAIAFFVVAFTPVGTSIAAYYSTIFGVGGMLVGVLLLLVILGGVLGLSPKDLITKKAEGEKREYYSYVLPAIGLLLVVFVAYVFSAATGTGIALPGLDSSTWTLIFVLVFVLLVITYATGAEKSGEHK